MGITNLIERLQKSPEYSRRIAYIHEIPSKQARFGTLSSPLPPELEAYLLSRELTMYRHQCAAIDLIREGKPVILTTPTASGKSLAYNIPIFERLRNDTEATALFLYPTKALAHDQLKVLREMEAYTGIHVRTAVYDGDTPQHQRRDIRERSRIVLSNPYELHHILPWHFKWGTFFQNLAFVVIDETHRYRGVFGSHMAFLLRRLVRIARLYGGDPRFILSTATIANPGEFSRRLTGMEAVVIDDDAAAAGTKHIMLYNPFYDGLAKRSAHLETSDLLVRSIQEGLQAICFTSSRKMAELITRWTKETLMQEGGGNPETVSAYRAGYLPEVRREVEDELKRGSLRGIVSTNALEVGIDIGSLDVAVISGYPGTMMSFWQQAGRAGRRSGSSLATLVAFNNPLEQYFMRHPETFFGKPQEHAIIDLENPYIIAGHLLCAAAEAPLVHGEECTYFGRDAQDILDSLKEMGLISHTASGCVYAGKGRAVDAVNLNSIASETFTVVCNGRVIETMDCAQAYREAHPGAVLLHLGETYLVEDLNLDERRIRVRKEDVEIHTEPVKRVETGIIEELKRKERKGVITCFGDIEVTEQYTGFRVKRFSSVIATESLDLPPIRFNGRGMWVRIPEDIADAVVEQGGDLAGGLHGAEHAIIAITPFHVMCDRWDIGGLSAGLYPDTGAPTIMLYDGYEGGIGLSEKAFQIFGQIVGTAHELVRDCGCEEGCPACILSPKCGNENVPMDKQAALTVLREIDRRLNPPKVSE